MPKRLKFLLAAQVEKVDRDARALDLADVQSDRGGDLRQLHSLVVRTELGLHLFQERRFAGIVQANDQNEVLVFLEQKSPESVE